MDYTKDILYDSRIDLDSYEKQFRENYKRRIFLPETPKSVYEAISYVLAGETTKYKRGGMHCTLGRSRSVVDIYKICLTYFPETKLKDVVDMLRTYEKSNSFISCYKGYGFCSNINRYRFAPLFQVGRHTRPSETHKLTTYLETIGSKDKKTRSSSSNT